MFCTTYKETPASTNQLAHECLLCRARHKRHTFASWLVQAGVSLYEVQRLLGHSSPTVTQVYSHLKPDQMHDTVNKISIPMN